MVKDKKNILILNWRDPKNPRSGGAEAVTLRYASYWSTLGHRVIWLCNTFPGCVRNETNLGVEFVRVGPDLGFTVLQLFTTYPLFLLHAIYLSIKIIYQNGIDLVIDEIHGLPFFTPLYTKIRKILLVCEVAGPIWDKMYPFPVSVIGKSLEKVIYFLYRHIETWAISENTRQDIFSLNANSNIVILPLGVDVNKRPITKKFPYPSAVFLGRLVKMKGVESAICSVVEIVRDLPNFRLSVVGSGSKEYVLSLREIVVKNKLDKNVTFYGHLNESEKFRLLARSHFLIHPSYKEGFGLTVLEAGLMGTPTIARMGSSLDELIKDKQSGLVFKSDQDIARLFKQWVSDDKYINLCRKAREVALNYSWDKILPKTKGLL